MLMAEGKGRLCHLFGIVEKLYLLRRNFVVMRTMTQMRRRCSLDNSSGKQEKLIVWIIFLVLE